VETFFGKYSPPLIVANTGEKREEKKEVKILKKKKSDERLCCPIFTYFNYVLLSKSKDIKVLFAEYLLLFANPPKKIFASICFEIHIYFETEGI
jgi:hypothetical protein